MKIHREYFLKQYALILVMAISIIFVGSQVVFAQTEPDSQLRLLMATGNSEVMVSPDMAQVRLGVETEATTAAAARQQNAERANRIIAAIRALGIPETAIQTSTFQIEPIRRFETQEQRGEPPIVGYRVVNIISVRTPQFDLVPRIIDESVRAGANRVESVDFMLRDDTAPSRTALRQAVADARENARAMAAELGVTLVSLHRVQQGGVGVIPPPIFYGRMAEAAVAAPTPILPGEVTVNASATLTYVIR